MSDRLKTLKVVLASPGDVTAERDATQPIVDLLNAELRDYGIPFRLELLTWETDAYPGLHIQGSQEHIDENLNIEESDVLVGVFGKRFGTPVHDAGSGTAHEIGKAIRAWRQNQRPQVMLYFKSIDVASILPNEAEQYE